MYSFILFFFLILIILFFLIILMNLRRGSSQPSLSIDSLQPTASNNTVELKPATPIYRAAPFF